MASSSSAQSGRRALSARFNRLRRKFHRSDDRARSTGSQPSNPTCDASAKSTLTTDSDAVPPDQSALLASQTEPDPANPSTTGGFVSDGIASSDIWSAAYREAVDSFGKDIDTAILMGKSAAHLFEELEKIDKDATQESVFLRGVAYLRSIQVPLERFKLALDLASPLTSFPVAPTGFGVLSSVTAIAVSFATADLEFAKLIGDMLEQISYIDDCDTLGQNANRADIHKSLVSVYQKILEFYKAAYEILAERGRKLVMKMILETDRLPNIVQDFLRRADTLRKLIEKATFEVVQDIKSMLYDREISRWLGGGKMKLQSQYHAALQDLRTDEAFEFLLTHPNFINWYSYSGSQQLVILGEMGSGKTVTMAFLADELSRRNEHQLPRPKVCYYYCRDDETGQAVYIFSALILALLEQLSGLKRTFYEWYKENQASGILQPETSVRKLEEFLGTVLETLDRHIFIIIDGLDECDRASRKALLKFLRTLLQKTPRLKVVLSSRPEEEIVDQLGEAPRIEMSSDICRDAIIVRHTVETRLSYLSEDVRELVIEKLSHSARGSAIWTKMTVELIELRKIRAFGPMSKFLQEMPLARQLVDLYRALISRSSSNDDENQKLAAHALIVLAVARRPLGIQELAWAVTLAAAEESVDTVPALAELVDHQRVTTVIYPFITRIDFTDLHKRQVQLVHQSVREFIVQEWSHLLHSATSAEPHQATVSRSTQGLELFILNICIRYLLLNDIGSLHLFSEEEIAIDALPQDVDLFNKREPFEYDAHCTWEDWEEDMIHYDPTERGFGEFFVYASSHWLDHFGAIESGPLPHLAKIESLCRASSTRLHNWINQNRRPSCTIKPRFDFDSQLYDPLSITSLFGSDAILRDMLENSNFENENYLPFPAIAAVDQVLQWGDLSRLRMLFLEGKLGRQLRNLEFFRLVIRRWSEFGARHDNWVVAFDLVNYVLDTIVEEKWGYDLLCVATRAGCMPIIQLLLGGAQQKAQLRTELLRGFQPIAEAVLGNHVDVVEYLLGDEDLRAQLQYVNSGGENVLHIASGLCNPAIFRLLVPHLQKGLPQTDNQGDTVLVRIIKSHSNPRNRYESARILLSQADVNWNSHIGGGQQDPLQTAVQLGDAEMCRLLICEGKMNPVSALTYGHNGQLILRNNPCRNEEDILQLLQEYAADASAS